MAIHLFASEETKRLANAVHTNDCDQFHKSLVKLYKSVLVFLARTIIHLHSNTLAQVLANIAVNNWRDLVSDIKTARTECESRVNSLRFTVLQDGQDASKTSLEKLVEMMEAISRVINDRFNTDKEIVSWISKINVPNLHKEVQDLIGRPFTASAGDWIDTSDTFGEPPLRKWMASDDPVFWIVGSGEKSENKTQDK